MPENTRTYPTFPIPAVGAIILNEEQVLLIQRGQAPAMGKWTLPGGVVELGESPEEALVREIKEECHLDITLDGVVAIINKVIRDEQGKIQYHYLILDYLAHCQSEEYCSTEDLQAGSDVTDARWISIDNLRYYDLTEGVFEVIQSTMRQQQYSNSAIHANNHLKSER